MTAPAAPTPPRLDRWLEGLGLGPATIDALTGDVSLRRYFRARLPDGRRAVIAYYPTKLRPVCRRFRLTTTMLHEIAVPAPAVLAADCRRGLMLLEDLGERTLYEEPEQEWSALAPLYHEAVGYVRRLQSLPRERVAAFNPPLDSTLLQWELRKSWELALVPRGLVGPPPVAEAFAAALVGLCDELGRAERLMPCHRDFMPRNLMRRHAGEAGRAGELVVLDHQDLRLGPPAYDVASLLNDSLFPPPALEEELRRAQLPGDEGALDYRRAVVQRTIKAVGNYCDFARRGFDRHLRLVLPTLARAWRWFPAVPELNPLVDELRPAWEALLGHLVD